MDSMERINKWKQGVIDDINILQRKIGVKNEEIERLKAEFLMETDSIKINDIKSAMYREVEKNKIPRITLNVTAARVTKQGELFNAFPTCRIDNILYDTKNIINYVERFCTTKSKKQVRFYLEKGRDTHNGYETLAKRDVTSEVLNLLNNTSFHTAYELRNEGECMNYE